MKKKLFVIITTFICLLVLSGCGCDHEWVDATCTAPKMCIHCGETIGEALGHVWSTATCGLPQTCIYCDRTTGTYGEHTWADANCVNPMMCTHCGATSGAALGHSWVNGTNEYGVPARQCDTCGESETFVDSWIPLTRFGSIDDSNTASKDGSYNDIIIGDWNTSVGLLPESLKFWVADRDGYTNTEYITYEFNGNYTTLSGIIAAGEDCEKGASMEILIYLDNRLAYESESLAYNAYTFFSIDVSDTDSVRIVCTSSSAQFAHCVVAASAY